VCQICANVQFEVSRSVVRQHGTYAVLAFSIYPTFNQQAVREAAQYTPAPVRRTLQPSSSPYTPYACGAQRALRHEYSRSTGSGSLWAVL